MDEQNKELENDVQPKAKIEKEKKSFSEYFREYKGEFDKIIWLSPKDLFKKTVMVIITSFLFGVIIFGMDSVYNLGYDLLVGLLG